VSEPAGARREDGTAPEDEAVRDLGALPELVGVKGSPHEEREREAPGEQQQQDACLIHGPSCARTRTSRARPARRAWFGSFRCCVGGSYTRLQR
jgi:hypothetical protein